MKAYENKLHGCECDGKFLLSMTVDDFHDVGIIKTLHIKRLQRWIEEWERDGVTVPPPPTELLK